MDFINAIVLLLNYIFVPALSYGSQLALGAIFVSLIYGILRFAYFSAGDLMSFGTMFTILFTWYFQSIGISLGVLPTALLAIPFAIIISILFTHSPTIVTSFVVNPTVHPVNTCYVEISHWFEPYSHTSRWSLGSCAPESVVG